MLDPKRPIREADIARRGWHGTKVPLAAITLRQDDNLTGGRTLIICHTASPWRAIVLQPLDCKAERLENPRPVGAQ